MRYVLVLAIGIAGGVLGGVVWGRLDGSSSADRRPARTDHAYAEARRVAERLDELARRLDELERDRPDPEPDEEVAPPRRDVRSPEPTDRRAAEATAMEGELTGAELAAKRAEVLRSILGREFGPDEAGRLFSYLTRNVKDIDATIAELKDKVAEDPENPELHTALATAYVAKLVNATPPGPQQGFVWQVAEASYERALKHDPEHWQARFGKAFGTAQMPAFLGRKPAAIRQFEELRKMQEQRAPEPHFAETYYQLGSLYLEAGNKEKAQEMWDQGLRLFPRNEKLRQAREVAEKR